MSLPALALVGVHKRFGSVDVIRGVDLQVAQGERYAVIGPNGAGKSSLFDLISGRTVPDRGQILLHGERIDGLRPFQIQRRSLSRSFQLSSLFPRLSVFDNIRCAMLWRLGYRYSFWHRLSRLKDARDCANDVLRRIGLMHRHDLAAGLLTYAEQRALEIGIAIASGAQVILLDEPTAGMNRAESAAMVALIREVTVGKTLLLVEHDMQVVFDLADRIAVMADGQVLACDTAARIRAHPEVRRIYLDRPGHAA